MAEDRDRDAADSRPSPLDDDSVPFYPIDQVAQILGLRPG
jgi:hypothetical protein